uniref:Uncharacterized protein n=1 Tax=Arundo donax TaxID=35708 RepID=A0A0A8ZSJ4_ARUDO
MIAIQISVSVLCQ